MQLYKHIIDYYHLHILDGPELHKLKTLITLSHIWLMNTQITLVVPSGLRWLRRSCLPENPTEDAARNLGRWWIYGRGYPPCPECLAAMLGAVVAPALRTDGPYAAGVP